MTWTSTTSQTRRLQASKNVWIPSEGQGLAVEHLIRNGSAVLWADVGAGKTSISLTAFAALKEMGMAKHALVMATVRICQLTWRQEAAKWEHTKHLNVQFLHGPKKDKMLEEGLRLLPGLGGVDIFLINYEGLPWLCEKYRGKGGLPFDTIIADELTKLKKHSGVRFKALKKATMRTPRKWGLTGTPAPNGYLDLFGQFLWIDGGASLGTYFTHYRDTYFEPDWNGFDYVLQRGAEARIKERIKDIIFRLEYTDLPAMTINDIPVVLSGAARKAYDTMRKEMLLNVPGGMVTAANAAAVYAKLKQMANGAVYLSGQEGRTKEWVVIHDDKLDALVELVEGMNGQPLLIAYQYEHDLVRIQARLKKEFGWDVPYLGKGVGEAEAQKLQADWNANKLPVLLCQPQSAGHGLNFQEGGAGHLCWFSADFNLETYDQFIGRIRRKGNPNERVVIHRLIVQNSLDELVFAALEEKDTTQSALLRGMRKVLQGEPIEPRAAAPRNVTEEDMTIRRLPAQGGAAPPPPVQTAQPQRPAPQPQAAAQPAAAPARVVPKGWGAQTSAASAPAPANTQAGAIQGKLQGAGSYVAPAPVEEADDDTSVADAALAHMNQAMGQAIQAGDEVREQVRQQNDGETPAAPAAVAPAKPRRASRASAAPAPAPQAEAPATQDDPNRFAPSAETARTTAVGAPAEVSIHFHGTPDAVAAAMLQLIQAFKNA